MCSCGDVPAPEPTQAPTPTVAPPTPTTAAPTPTDPATTTTTATTTATTTTQVTTSATTTTGGGARVCVHQKDCDISPWCNDGSYDKYCADTGALNHCEEPACYWATGTVVVNKQEGGTTATTTTARRETWRDRLRRLRRKRQGTKLAQIAKHGGTTSCPDGGCASQNTASAVLLQMKSEMDGAVTMKETVQEDAWINVCYFTNWARYRSGLINTGKDVFEMDTLGAESCTHFMYGFASVVLSGESYKLESSDPNADHPTGHAAQTTLCDDACNDPNFKPDWNDADGIRCDWPCSPTRKYRGFEGLNVGMKKRNPNIKSLISVGGWNFNDCSLSPAATYGQGSATCEIFSTIAASEEQTKKFAKNVIDFCRTWGFDGFDLDWEYPVKAGHNNNTKVNGAYVENSQDYVNYITMLRIMKEEFAAEGASSGKAPLLLTAAVGIGKSTVA